MIILSKLKDYGASSSDITYISTDFGKNWVVAVAGKVTGYLSSSSLWFLWSKLLSDLLNNWNFLNFYILDEPASRYVIEYDLYIAKRYENTKISKYDLANFLVTSLNRTELYGKIYGIENE